MIDSCCVLNKFFLRLNFSWVTYITMVVYNPIRLCVRRSES